MNLFRNLIGKVWQDPNAAEVVKISTGQLYLVRPGNIRSSRECIYNDAMATIRRVPSAEHNFQLVITRVYEDGDQELLEEADETDEERTFLIGEELEFRTGETDGEPTFIWRDLRGDVDELFEYVAQGTNGPTKTFFEICMLRAMYERKYKAAADNLSDAELEEFMWKPPTIETKKPTPRKKAVQPEPLTSSPPPPIADKGKAGAALQEHATTVIVSSEAELYLWSTKGPQPEWEEFGTFTAQIVQRVGEHRFWLSALKNGSPVLAHEIPFNMNERWSPKMFSLTWNQIDENDTDVTSWLFRFPNEDVYASFQQAFTAAGWENKFQAPWSKIKADEQAYILSSASEDIEMANPEDEEEEDEDEVLSELEAGSDSEGSEDESEDEEAPKMPDFNGAKNSMLAVGYKGDRSYVVRGNNIGVFSHDAENHARFMGTMANLVTPKGKTFTPKELMLHDQDSKMILMNPTDPNSLFNIDIERGKIVEEWKVHDDVTVDHIAPDNKFAPTTHEKTLVGASHNALFRIDPRVSGTKMVDSQYKQYASKNKFSGIATTASGKLAVASEKGDIRLFDSIGKNAKTALPPLGDPILGIDTTADGRWIVATTRTYLLLIDTLIGEGKYQGSLGFDRSFPANAKPIPKRLQLRSEHVAYMNHDVSFTPARFNQGQDAVENAIVTSTGQFIIAWDFSKVKKGMLDRYEIKKYEDHVVQDNFKFGDDKEIIVALQNDVMAINKKNLTKPTRASLSGQLANARSRSNIVNTPW
ncbi:VID27-domain-containing protein [Hymenopellis radicata]|nr:VID27-domain-containing protein [Hymenopellis radicata]